VSDTRNTRAANARIAQTECHCCHCQTPMSRHTCNTLLYSVHPIKALDAHDSAIIGNMMRSAWVCKPEESLARVS